MNGTGIVEKIRQNPDKLILIDPVNFRRRTRSNPVDFADFLQAIGQNATASVVELSPSFLATLSNHAREGLFRMIGGLVRLRSIVVRRHVGVQLLSVRHVAEMLRVCRNVAKLALHIDSSVLLFGHEAAFEDLAHAIRNHHGLEVFRCPLPPVFEGALSDAIIAALTTCPKLRCVALFLKAPISDESMRALSLVPTMGTLSIQRQTITQRQCQWNIVADALSNDSTKLQSLDLFEPEADLHSSLALADSLAVNTTLKLLNLSSSVGFHDAFGVALAEALKKNRTPRTIILRTCSARRRGFSENACRAIIDMLKYNHKIRIYAASCRSPDCSPWLGDLVRPTDAARLRPLLQEIFVQRFLILCGRGTLTRCKNPLAWIVMLSRVRVVRAKHGRLLSRNFSNNLTLKFDTPLTDDELDCVELECLSTLLKMNPSLCAMRKDMNG